MDEKEHNRSLVCSLFLVFMSEMFIFQFVYFM